MKITVAGSGYVGVSTAALISNDHDVLLYDINQKKINKINEGGCPINDSLLEDFIKKGKVKLKASSSEKEAFSNKDVVVIATNTNSDENGQLNTDSIIDCSKKAIEFSPRCTIVIRSTVPIGFTEKLKLKLKKENIIFSPEFLRENSAFEDNLYPDRIIVGGEIKYAQLFLNLLSANCKNKNVHELICSCKEAESIKLFANAYLAMRIAYFNELATICSENNLRSEKIIKGVCLDKRIGETYNRPSFAFAGHCLEKDTKQLISISTKPSETLLNAVLKSNERRVDYIVKKVMETNPLIVGIYKLSSNDRPDSIQYSATLKVLYKLSKQKIKIFIYDPVISDFSIFKNLENIIILKRLDDFIEKSYVILTEKIDNYILHAKAKIITSDISNEDLKSI